MRITASSPVNIQPSRKVSFVAFALFKYPSTTLGDRIASSPGVSYSKNLLTVGGNYSGLNAGEVLTLEPNQMSVVVVPLGSGSSVSTLLASADNMQWRPPG